MSVLALEVLERPPRPHSMASIAPVTNGGGSTTHVSSAPGVKLEQGAMGSPRSGSTGNVAAPGNLPMGIADAGLLTPNGIHLAIQRKVDTSHPPAQQPQLALTLVPPCQAQRESSLCPLPELKLQVPTFFSRPPSNLISLSSPSLIFKITAFTRFFAPP
jgi:hypothetical protein